MSHILRSVFSSVSRNLINRRHLAVVGLSTICIVAGICAYWSRSVAALVFKNGPTPVTHLLSSSSRYSIEAPVPTCTPQTGLIISEFRLRGANGVNDEFIEFYNNTDQNIIVCTADGSNGWALVSSDGIVRFVIPADTVIPARAHFLAVGSGYGLAAYAAGDLTYVPDTPDNLGLALFNNASAINFTISNRLDAVGFSTTLNALSREGSGLPALMTTNGQYSFIRKPTTGYPQDTGDNSADFYLISTDAGNYGTISILGAPGPEGLTSPLQRNSILPVTVIDPAVGQNVAPNRVRDTTAIGPNAAAGTLTIRRKITNNTGGVVTFLRVRIYDITTLNTPGYAPGGAQADMRALTSSDVTVTLTNGTQVLVRGTSLESPPSQPNGGGLNSALGVFAYSLAQPLAPGASTNVQFMLGVQQSGSFRFFVNVEALYNTSPAAVTGGPYSGPAGSPVQFNGSGSSDSEGQIAGYQWDFGDGGLGTGPSPSHTYSTQGTYNVTLTVTDSGGLTASATTTATIYPASNKMPVPIIAGPFSAVAGSATQFSSTGSFDPDGTIAQYKWDFGGLGSATGASPSFTFTNRGTHLVSLMVTDNWGAKSLTSINVTVTPAPGGENLEAGTETVSDWDSRNRPSLDDPRNDRGTPANKVTGNNNFQLVAPVLSLPGRGIDLNLNLVYNSLVWNSVGNGNDMYFDIDHDSPAAGWHLGFGKVVNMGTAGCMLIEPDGTRHSFKGSVFTFHYNASPTGQPPAIDIPVFKGETTDGSMIEYRCEPSSWQNPSAIARYPNGTVVSYTNLSSGAPAATRNYLYPTNIRDKNGNAITINYTWPDAEPRILRVVDSVGRAIEFHYDTQKRLTSITGPDLKDANGNPTPPRTFVRLHYTTLPLGLTNAFTGSTHVRNSSPFVLDAIYYPATNTGYTFGPGSYSSYGMLLKVTQQRGMSFTQGSTPDEQGTINGGTVTRTQTYDYPATPQNLTSAPVFNKITETWDGGTAPTETNFLSVDNATTNERTITVTNPDSTRTEQVAFSLNSLADSDPNKFKNGLTKEERRVASNGTVIQKTVFTWEAGFNGVPRLQQTVTTDERGQSLKSVYDQFGDHNSVGRTRDYDYSGTTVIRTTINSFLSYADGDLDQGIDVSRGTGVLFHPRLINLVTSTKIFQGDDSANVLAAYTEVKYDEYAETLKSYPRDGSSTLDIFIFGESRQTNGITGILNFAAFFSPEPRSSTTPNGGFGSDYFTKRGNATSVTKYADTSNATLPASPVIEKMKYDMAGNVISSSKSCCEEQSSNFNSLASQYAFPASRTRGAADTSSLLRITTSTTYDLGVGLPILVTDANNRTARTNYFSGSLRTKEIISPTGARVTFDYDDVAMKTTQTTRLSANGTITAQSTKYFNGLGQIKKEEALGASGAIDIVETLYDNFGRLSKESIPYRTGQTPQWRETVYDPAGRVAEKRDPALPDYFEKGPVYPGLKYFYNEATRPSGASTEPGQTTRTVDAWERWRWARLDAAGRLVEVVEPNPAGGQGLQTKYTYNALDKLTRTEQDNQVRRFRYDSLGRLTAQKLAEKDATLNLAGQWTTAGTVDDRWSDIFTYDERSNLISKTDARGVKTIYKYKDSNNVDDPLNRLQSISYDVSGVPASLTVVSSPTVTYQYRTKTQASDLIDVSQVKQVVAAGVITEDYSFEPDGRVQEKRFTFAGRPQSMKTTYTYDELGRTSQITYPEQYHDNVGTPVRKAVVPSYDPASRVTGLKVNNADYASQITYNAASQITSALIGTGTNQLTETYTYDQRSEALTRQTVTRGGATLMDYSYGYKMWYCDNPMAMCAISAASESYTGQLTRVTNNGPIGEWKTQYFQYDELSRLKEAQQYKWIEHVNQVNPNEVFFDWEFRIYWQQIYSYDRYGNRTGVAASNTTGQPVAQDGHASLTFEQTSNRITSSGFSYDPAGNQLTNNTGQSFVYDAAGRLVKVKSGTTTVATYAYDAENRRVITQTGSETSTDKTYYIWEGKSVITEYAEQTSATMPKWSKNYIYIGDRLLATEAPNGAGEIVQYQHPDRLGTRLVTNNLDTTFFSQDNLPFGTSLNGPTEPTTNRRFTSYDRSATSGLDYAINRHYDPRQGRFTQPDPLGMAAASLGDPQSLNMYTYCGNDPVSRTDPDGQFWGALFNFIVGLFRNLRPNVINGSFTYRNVPPISVSFTPNFQNIGVGFAGIGFDLRTAGHWLPAILGIDEKGDPDFNLEFLHDDSGNSSYSSSKESLITSLVKGLLSDACTKKFTEAGLTTPRELLKRGVVIGPASLLLNSGAENVKYMGITEYARNRVAKGANEYNTLGVTVRDVPGFRPDTIDGRPRIFLNMQAFNGLGDVIRHEFIHAGGQTAHPVPFGNDLDYMGYTYERRWGGGGKWPYTVKLKTGVTEPEILAACR
jgi:RHS repeat-associated protein